MTRIQFARLARVFWKTATAEQLAATYVEYHRALDDLPDTCIATVVDRAIRECQEMPKPWQLREWARAIVQRVAPPAHDEGRCATCGGRVEPARRPPRTVWRNTMRHADGCAFFEPGLEWWFDLPESSRPALPEADWRDVLAAVKA